MRLCVRGYAAYPEPTCRIPSGLRVSVGTKSPVWSMANDKQHVRSWMAVCGGIGAAKGCIRQERRERKRNAMQRAVVEWSRPAVGSVAEVPQVDHRVGQGLGCVVRGAECARIESARGRLSPQANTRSMVRNRCLKGTPCARRSSHLLNLSSAPTFPVEEQHAATLLLRRPGKAPFGSSQVEERLHKQLAVPSCPQ